jgi:hypothetical protein
LRPYRLYVLWMLLCAKAPFFDAISTQWNSGREDAQLARQQQHQQDSARRAMTYVARDGSQPGHVSLVRIVMHLRHFRPGMVQTRDQASDARN